MAFYHDLITEKSWQLLQELRKKYDFILKEFDWQKYQQLVTHYDLREDLEMIKTLIKQTRELPELSLNVHQMARVKGKIRPLLEEENCQ